MICELCMSKKKARLAQLLEVFSKLQIASKGSTIWRGQGSWGRETTSTAQV
jgi:hypothetical protein